MLCCIICDRDDEQSNLRKVATDKVAKLNNNFQLLSKLIGQRCWYFLSCPMLHTSSRHSTHFNDHIPQSAEFSQDKEIYISNKTKFAELIAKAHDSHIGQDDALLLMRVAVT